MATKRKLAILGGDGRQIAMVNCLSKMGYEVLVWGLGDCRNLFDEKFLCQDWERAVTLSDAVILPLPASLDGISVNCARESPGAFLRISGVLDAMRGRMLLGGKLSETVCALAEKRGIQTVDYFDSEILQLKNALPTAEGAISIAMNELPITIDGLTCAVIGYGRIGSILARKLHALGAHVTVYARRAEIRTLAELDGHCAKSLDEGNGYVALSALPVGCRVVFNTVPTRVMTKEFLDCVPKNCVLIDLASAPGGIDLCAARELGLRCVWGTALPGKHTPESAGHILAQTIDALLEDSPDPIA